MGWETFLKYIPLLLQGTRTTLLLFALTLIIGFMLALPVALARNSARPLFYVFGYGFILFFRGAPLLAILFLVYYGLPQVPGIKESAIWFLIRDPFPVAVIALALNSAGFQAEIIAGAMRNVPRPEIEAALSAGFSRLQVFLYVVAPHATRIAIRSYGNEATFIVKGTAVVSFITVIDLLSAANQVYFKTFDPITPLLAAALIYLLIIFVLMRIVRWTEIRLTPELRVEHHQRRAATRGLAPPSETFS
jgi:His/Glu/Gln/Arg/opine family amino acid ABC transporter permease subunit